jgi:ankyrin repeat protein
VIAEAHENPGSRSLEEKSMRKGVRATALAALGLAVLLGAGAPDAPIADAAMRGDVEAVRALLKKGAEVNAAQGDGMTALHWAANNRSVEMTKLLISAGAQLDAPTRIGAHTPLHVAAEEGAGDVVKTLADAGANVKAVTSTGVTPLHFAAEAGTIDGIEALVAHGADVNARETAWGQTPLMFAAAKGRLDAVKALLAHKADVAVTSKVISFAKLAQAERRAGAVRDSLLKQFREKSADPIEWHPDPTEVQAALKAAREKEPVAPEEKVVHLNWDSLQTAGKAMRGGEDVGFQGGLTALIFAVREGQRDVAFALLDGGANINQQSAGDLSTPLLSAMLNGYYDMGLELLARGADPNIAGAYPAGVTPLYAVINTQWASKSRYPQQQAYQQQKHTHLETMEALLKAGANPNARLTADYWYNAYNFVGVGINFWGATPFLRAAHGLDIDAMKLLVKYGADPNIPTKAPPDDRAQAGGTSAAQVYQKLHGEGNYSGVPEVPNGGPCMYPIHAVAGNSGEGAGRAGNAHHHVRDGWLPAMKYLVEELHADVNVRDCLGYGTIHGAAGRGNDDVIKYLVSKGADPLMIGYSGLSAVDLANGPADGTSPYLSTVALLESMGVVNHHLCVFC